MAGIDLYAAVKTTDEALTITLPVKLRYAVIGYGLFLLLVPALFAAELITRLRSNAEIFWPVVWPALIIMSLVLVSSVSEILWLLMGHEVLMVNEKGIQLSHVLAGLSYTKRFAARAIDGIFVSREPFPHFVLFRDWEWRNFHRGRVALNSGRNLFGVRTFRFGEVLTAEEARSMVDQILERYPQYRYHAH